MTRRSRSKRSVETRLDALEREQDAKDGQPPVEVVFRDDGTGELTDGDGTPVEPDPDARTVIFNEEVVSTPWGDERIETVGVHDRETREFWYDDPEPYPDDDREIIEERADDTPRFE